MHGGIFITGGAGKTGRALLELLTKRMPPGEIACLVRPGRDRSPLASLGVRIVEGDAADRSAVARAWSGEETVVHLSSILHAGAVVRGCRGARRLVAVSSAGRYSRHRDIAGAIAAGEETIERSDFNWTILRPTMIYGVPGDRNVSLLAGLVARLPLVPLPGARSRLQPVFVDDLAGAIAAALGRPESAGRSYDISGGSAHPLGEILRILARLMGRRARIVPLPLPPARVAARVLHRLTGLAFLDPARIDRLLEDRALSHEDAARDLGFRPRTFEEGAAILVERMGLAPASD